MEKAKTTVLSFKYGTSKGRNTYGYGIVTLYANGEKVARTCGGGYDMKGTCLGRYITEKYQTRLENLPANYGSEDHMQGFYGLVHISESGKRFHVNLKNAVADEDKARSAIPQDIKTYIDGACGLSCVERIAEAIGVHLESVQVGPNKSGYILTDTKK